MIRLFLILEMLLFFAASSLHFGLLAKGHEHSKARVAELVIGLVLLSGFVFTFLQPANQVLIGPCGARLCPVWNRRWYFHHHCRCRAAYCYRLHFALLHGNLIGVWLVFYLITTVM